jgi:two-component system, chemotaxis family, chemotaxis protein CheY
MNENRQERRKHERFPFREDVLIDGSRMCTSMDISEGGLYISTIQSYAENDVIEVTIPFKEEKFTVSAQVRYCQPGIGMGVMFIDLKDAQKAGIRELISSVSGRPVRSPKGQNILLVEDNGTSRQAIKGALTKEGFSVMEASDGIEAIKVLSEKPADLVILDLYMKGMDGLKVLSLMKSDRRWKEIPVIICSAHDTQDVKDRVISAGADEFIPKKGTSPARLAESARAVFERLGKSR